VGTASWLLTVLIASTTLCMLRAQPVRLPASGMLWLSADAQNDCDCSHSTALCYKRLQFHAVKLWAQCDWHQLQEPDRVRLLTPVVTPSIGRQYQPDSLQRSTFLTPVPSARYDLPPRTRAFRVVALVADILGIGARPGAREAPSWDTRRNRFAPRSQLQPTVTLHRGQ
jgi:hypothetical protein